MFPIKELILAIAVAGLIGGCAKPPSGQATLTTSALPNAPVGAVSDQAMPAVIEPPNAAAGQFAIDMARVEGLEVLANPGDASLAGRTIRVGSAADFAQLKPGEVVLTFDDGPNPSTTPKILDILAEYNVKAVFFMVGKMAKNHPQTAQMVARAGQTIGSHSYGHEKFPKIGYDAAMLSVAKAQTAINDALAPTGRSVAPFFRFPYMASTSALNTGIADEGWTLFSFDADSWDYLDQTPEKILNRTLRRLDAKGGGIVLFHDIHARTVKVLPAFLDALKERGFKVVRVLPKSTNFVTAIAPVGAG